MVLHRMTAVLATALLMIGATLAAGKQDFMLGNETGFPIKEVYVSPTNTEAWQEDVLGSDELMNGDQTQISFRRAEKSCAWDLMVVYRNEVKAVWPNLDLCRVEAVTIRYNSKTRQTVAVVE